MDEVSLLASLRFAPIDPTPMTVQTETGPSDTIEVLHDQLQSLVAQQQACLFDGVGNIHDTRTKIVETMSALRDEVDRRLAQERMQLVRWLGMREDTEDVPARIARLKADDDDESSDVLQRLVEEQDTLDRELEVLQRRRATVVESIRRERDRIEAAQRQRSAEVEALERLPSHASVLAQLSALRGTIQTWEDEVEALGSGIPLFARVVAFLQEAELDLADLLRTQEGETDVRRKLQSCIDSLKAWLDESRERSWRLLEVLIEAEKTSYEEALVLVSQRSSNK